MTESSEPSYYEIALTNRQVLVSFVVLLACVVIAFLSGVWVGRNESTLLAAEGGRQLAATGDAASDLEQLEELEFFAGEDGDGSETLDKPDLSALVDSPRPDTTLAEDLGAQPSPPPSPPAQPAQAVPPPPPPRIAPQQPAQQRPARAASGAGFVIQVFSSRDQEQADRVHGQLADAGYPAFLSPVEVGSSTMYRVRVGPFPRRPAAELQAQEINTRFKLDTWITAASGS